MNTRVEKKIATLPQQPGVYFFLGARKKILYIGKATNLRSRVRSYFTGDIVASRSPLIAEMVELIADVDVRKTDSVLEALILEANLIKTHKPLYNTREKDDKSNNFVVITNEDFPRVLVERGHTVYQTYDESEIKYIFGPFPQGSLFKEAMKLIRKLFPYFDTKRPVAELAESPEWKKVTFNQQIGVYPNVLDKKAYRQTIQHLRLFFEGKKMKLVKEIEKDMKAYAKIQEFEKAEVLKRRLYGVQHIQDVSLIKEEFRTPGTHIDQAADRIEAYDVAHLGGHDAVGVMVVSENGSLQKSQYRKFNLKQAKGGDDPGALREILSRRLDHAEWPLPKVIVVDGHKAQINAAHKVLREAGVLISIVGVVKDEHHRPRELVGDKTVRQKYEREILLANNDAHRFAITVHRAKRGKLK